MLHLRSRTTFTQGMLSYLLGLYLIGFSWHLYVHTQDSFHNEVANAYGVAVSEDACAACEWLTHHHFTLNSSAIYPLSSPDQFTNIQEGLHSDYSYQSAISGSSRAPPLGLVL